MLFVSDTMPTNYGQTQRAFLLKTRKLTWRQPELAKDLRQVPTQFELSPLLGSVIADLPPLHSQRLELVVQKQLAPLYQFDWQSPRVPL
jgi:hypothetical protein